jgi:hypothetical protein
VNIDTAMIWAVLGLTGTIIPLSDPAREGSGGRL